MELHPAILVQETIDKFGYDPRFLPKWSKKQVRFQCSSCMTVINSQMSNVSSRSTALCVFCCKKRSVSKMQSEIEPCQPHILIEETINRFGYDPNTLSNKSSKLVVVQCNKCGIKRVSKKQSARPHCSTCCAKFPRKQSSILIDIHILVELVYRGSINQGQIFLGNQRSSHANTEAILNILERPKTTRELKQKAIKLIIHKDITYILKAMSIVLERYRTLFYRNKTGYVISDCHGLAQKLCDNMGFVIRPCKKDRFTIKSGSFFINGEWIHIG